MRRVNVKIYKGQTLLGLMISLALSAFLLLVVAQFYSQTQVQNQQMMLRLKLQAEIQRTLQLIGKDLRRAGFRSIFYRDQRDKKVKKDFQSNLALFGLEQGKDVIISQADGEKEKSCVLFFYDLSNDGCVGTGASNKSCINGNANNSKEIGKEIFGYKLNGNNIETKQSKTKLNDKCSAEQCQTYLQQPACNERGGWTDLLDDSEYEITQLEFDWIVPNKGIEVKLAGRLTQFKQVQYASSIVVPLMNAEDLNAKQ